VNKEDKSKAAVVASAVTMLGIAVAFVPAPVLAAELSLLLLGPGIVIAFLIAAFVPSQGLHGANEGCVRIGGAVFNWFFYFGLVLWVRTRLLRRRKQPAA
jgi:hypothetical protein